MLLLCMCFLGILVFTQSSLGASFVTYTNQSSHHDWTEAIWSNTIAGGTLVSPVAGNGYEVLSNALIRPPTSVSTASSPIVFPGDSLKLDGGGSIRLKSNNPPATGFFTFDDQGGQLILNGGQLDAGDDMVSVVYSSIYVVTNTSTTINAGQDSTTISVASGTRQGFRNYIFYGGLSGSGTVTFGNAIMYNNPQVTATNFGSTNANFSFQAAASPFNGNINVTAGWLQAGAVGALGGGNITLAGGSSVNGVNGPAQFDATVGFSDSGTLTIQDANSTLLLDTNMAFGAVIFDGKTLTNGVYTAAHINAITGYTNAVDGTGNNTLTVGPVVSIFVKPTIIAQTGSQTNSVGTSLQLLVFADGTLPLSYQWRAGAVGSGVYTNVINGGNLSGATNSVLTITNVLPYEQADYVVVITNFAGSVTSSVPTTVTLLPVSVTGPIPASDTLYPGGTASFSVSAQGIQLTYQWAKIVGGVTNEILNATNSTLIIKDVGPSEAASYGVAVSTPYGSTNSPLATLVVFSAPSDSYGQWVMSKNPVAYWRLSEGSGMNAFDYSGGHTATYGPDVYLQDSGPAGPGFPVGNTSLSPENNQPTSSYATLPPTDGLDLNTNAATIVAWVKPSELIPNAGIVFQRDASGVAGLNLTANGDLGFNWNNAASTLNWDSGLALPTGTWSLVVLAVTATNATIYMYNSSQQASATLAVANAVTPFSGLLELGNDPLDSNGDRVFSGDLAEIAIYNHTLSNAEIVQLFTIGSGLPVGPSIAAQPQSQWVLPGSTVQFNVIATGTAPLFYQWQEDTGSGLQNILGATNSGLILSNVGPANVASYDVIVNNSVSSVTSSGATLALLSVSGFESNVMKTGPLGYWPLNETSGTTAFDCSGNGFHGIYESGVTLAGPGPNPPFIGFDSADNVGPMFTGATNSYVSLPSLNFTSANVTFAAWIYPTVTAQTKAAGIVFNRDSVQGGLCFDDGGTNLSYGWNQDSMIFSYETGLVPPSNQWSFVALVITPTNATFYLYNTNSRLTNVNPHNHLPAAFTGETRIASDSLAGGNREFTGQMAQVALYNYSLSAAQIGQVYTNGGVALPVLPSDANLSIAPQSGGGFQLNWNQGTLLEATNLTGPWTTNSATSPYAAPTTAPQKFYRVRLQ